MSEAALLQACGVTRALVVDDAFDEVPTPDDLLVEADEWSRLFDDLSEADKDALLGAYPPYGGARADDLRGDAVFIRVLWELRATFESSAAVDLFRRYEQDKVGDRAALTPLVDYLSELGLECATCGKTFVDRAADADLIFVDLYLSAGQRETDIDLSVQGIKQVVEARKASPPLVVLMSRATSLSDKRTHFRDKAQLFDSAFRILSKSLLSDRNELARTVTRLATHSEDTRRLVAFVCAWENGMERARDRTVALIRQLRLADLAQIYDLLLSGEGEPTGSYLVDVFDMVLQHEIERDDSIIDAALELNKLAGRTFPPPYVPGDPELQNLIYRMWFQNPVRLRLPGSLVSNVAFGDLLRPSGQPVPNKPTLIDKFAENVVLAVMTPACDLQRCAAKSILMIVGELEPLHARSWSYKEGLRTPVIEMPDGSKRWIRWDLQHIVAWGVDDIKALFDAGRLSVVARMRELQALEMQQRLLSTLGRVGVAAPMPATFEVELEAFYPAGDNTFKKLDIAVLRNAGVCFVGRQATGTDVEERLVLTETACDALGEALTSIRLEDVHPAARALFEALRQSPSMIQALERGALIHSSKPDSWKAFTTDDGRTLGFVRKNPVINLSQITEQRLRAAAVFLVAMERRTPDAVERQELPAGVEPPEANLEQPGC